MFEFVYGFLFGLLVSWPGLVGLLMLGILAEHNESHGMSIFFGLLTAVGSYFYFNLSLMVVVYGLIGYLLIGLIWSFWRYKRYVTYQINLLNDSQTMTDLTTKWELDRLMPSENLGLITSWIIIWPFSMIDNVCADLINLIHSLVTKVFKGVYLKIYTSAISNLKK